MLAFFADQNRSGDSEQDDERDKDDKEERENYDYGFFIVILTEDSEVRIYLEDADHRGLLPIGSDGTSGGREDIGFGIIGGKNSGAGENIFYCHEVRDLQLDITGILDGRSGLDGAAKIQIAGGLAENTPADSSIAVLDDRVSDHIIGLRGRFAGYIKDGSGDTGVLTAGSSDDVWWVNIITDGQIVLAGDMIIGFVESDPAR